MRGWHELTQIMCRQIICNSAAILAVDLSTVRTTVVKKTKIAILTTKHQQSQPFYSAAVRHSALLNSLLTPGKAVTTDGNNLVS